MLLPMPLRPCPPVVSCRRRSHRARLLLALSMVALLGACASGPRPGSAPQARVWATDGPGDSPPADLASIPDAVPSVEPMRSGPMRPYRVNGLSYRPMTEDLPLVEQGIATWYGRKYHGRPTASGEPYDMYAMSAAHPTMPLPSYARVRNLANAREVIVRINDRGPFHRGRIIDLSYTAAHKLGLLRAAGMVEVTRITQREILDGSWRQDPAAPAQMPRIGRADDPSMVQRPDSPHQAAAAAAPALALPVPDSATAAIGGAAPDVATGAVAIALPVSPAAPHRASELPATATVDAMSEGDLGYWVQLGAFRQRSGASAFQQRVGADLGWLAPSLELVDDAGLHRLQAGPYPDRDQAAAVAQRVREELQLVPVIVERR